MMTYVALALSLSLSLQAAGTKEDVQSIEHLIASYATSIDNADTKLAEQIWSTSPDVSFIHPRGEEHGLSKVEQNFYRDTMGAPFSERKLTIKGVSVHVYNGAAWAEFTWDFVAKLRTDGTLLKTSGRETQVYTKEQGQWRLIHVHYSGVPVTGERNGF
jgi:ketosteroid isomerase-like protein